MSDKSSLADPQRVSLTVRTRQTEVKALGLVWAGETHTANVLRPNCALPAHKCTRKVPPRPVYIHQCILSLLVLLRSKASPLRFCFIHLESMKIGDDPDTGISETEVSMDQARTALLPIRWPARIDPVDWIFLVLRAYVDCTRDLAANVRQLLSELRFEGMTTLVEGCKNELPEVSQKTVASWTPRNNPPLATLTCGTLKVSVPCIRQARSCLTF